MTHYLVLLQAVREKVNLIKLVRRINGWGLKDSKDWVEDNFCFDLYLDGWAEFEVILTTEQLGILTAYVYNAGPHDTCHDKVEIMRIKEVTPANPNLFDFTRPIFD